MRAPAALALAAAVACTAPASEAPEAWVREVEAPQYFAVQVRDVDRSVAWYRDAFGLELREGSAAEDGSWRIQNLGNDRLHVEIVRDDRAAEAGRTPGFFKVGFRVPDVAAVADRVEAATGERPRIVDAADFGVRLLQLRDPDGNIVQLSDAWPG